MACKLDQASECISFIELDCASKSVPVYNTLAQAFTQDGFENEWPEGMYHFLERQIMNVLEFNLNFVTPDRLIRELMVCSNLVLEQDAPMILAEAQTNSYLIMFCKWTVSNIYIIIRKADSDLSLLLGLQQHSYSAAEIAIASLSAALGNET